MSFGVTRKCDGFRAKDKYGQVNAEAPARFSQRALADRCVMSDSLLTNQARSVAEASRSRSRTAYAAAPESRHRCTAGFPALRAPTATIWPFPLSPSPNGAGEETAPILAPRPGMNYNSRLRGTPDCLRRSHE